MSEIGNNSVGLGRAFPCNSCLKLLGGFPWSLSLSWANNKRIHITNFVVGYVKEMQTTKLLADSLGKYCLTLILQTCSRAKSTQNSWTVAVSGISLKYMNFYRQKTQWIHGIITPKYVGEKNLYDSMKIIKNKGSWEAIRPHFTMVQIKAGAHSLGRAEGTCRSGLPWGGQGSPITRTEGAVDVPLLAPPRGEPPDKAGEVLLHKLLTVFCTTTTKSVLTHF